MSGWSIDTLVARAIGRAAGRLGDDLAADQRPAELDLDALRLGSSQSTLVQRLAAASTELWVSAAFVDLVVDRVEAADTGLEFAESFDRLTVERLRMQAGDRVRVTWENACLAPWVTPAYSSAFGDLGGTFGLELRSPFYVTGSSPAERGRSLVMRALTDTVGEVQIRTDEFELVALDTGGYLVVLAGVTDLSRPDLGLSDRNRTVRDVDVYAYPSAQSAAVADNHYAEMVWAGLLEAGVPAGAQLMIVGHSYGADTALDLASDPGFTSRYRLTHVVAAGYNSQPQLRSVDPNVEVLVLQNHRDVPVIVETAAHGHPTELVEHVGGFFDAALGLDLVGAVQHELSIVHHAAGTVTDATTHVIAHSDDIARASAGVATGDIQRAAAELDDLVLLEPRVEQVGDRQVVDVFAGGGEGFGHHQSNYIDHLESVDDERVLEFLASVDAAGFATSGTTWAVDVSVP